MVLVEVKDGIFGFDQFWNILHIIGRENAECCIFSTLHPVLSPNGKRVAALPDIQISARTDTRKRSFGTYFTDY